MLKNRIVFCTSVKNVNPINVTSLRLTSNVTLESGVPTLLAAKGGTKVLAEILARPLIGPPPLCRGISKLRRGYSNDRLSTILSGRGASFLSRWFGVRDRLEFIVRCLKKAHAERTL